MIEMRVPILPEDTEQVKVVTIHCEVGQRVEREDVLFEIETDKVILDIVAPEDGVITSIKVAVGESLEQESLICVVDADEDTYQEDVDHIQAMIEADISAELAGEPKPELASEAELEPESALELEAELEPESALEPEAELEYEAALESNPDSKVEVALSPEDELSLNSYLNEKRASAIQEVPNTAKTSEPEEQPTEGPLTESNERIDPVFTLDADTEQAGQQEAQQQESTSDALAENESSVPEAIIAEEIDADVEGPSDSDAQTEVEKTERQDGFVIFMAMVVAAGILAGAYHYFGLGPLIKQFIATFM